MKKRLLYVAALAILLVQGCAMSRVSTDYQPEHDFTQPGSFFLLAPTDDQKATPEISELNLDRIRQAVSQELGYRYPVMESQDKASYWVRYYVVLKEKVDVVDTSLRFGYFHYPYHWSFGPDLDVNQYTEETLIIDVIDAKTEKQVWRGATSYRSRAFSEPAKQEAYLHEKVREILAKFPPY